LQPETVTIFGAKNFVVAVTICCVCGRLSSKVGN